MMHDKAMRRFGAVISSLVCGAVVACAGGDTPAVSDEFERALSDNFRNGGVAVAGGGAGGRAPTASAGSAGASMSGSGGAGGALVGLREVGGAAGAPPTTETPPANGACDGFAVLQRNCSGGSCHGAGGLGDFADSEEAAAAFVGVEGTVTCAGEGPLLNPDNPRQSIIVQKVNGAASCGQPMPISAPPLSDDEISCLEEWIATL